MKDRVTDQRLQSSAEQFIGLFGATFGATFTLNMLFLDAFILIVQLWESEMVGD